MNYRIYSPYAIMIMANVCLSKYYGQGPFYPKDGFEIEACRETWWTNLLFLNNFIGVGKEVILPFI